MSHLLNRRGFLIASASAGTAAGFLGLVPSGASAGDAEAADAPANEVSAEFPRQGAALAAEVVGASHVKFDRVKELVTARPALAKSAWDWGFGDWETALGAASHTGRRDIAQLLMDHGARPDIFTLATFGNVDAVKAAIDAQPGLQRMHGPHGITLLFHAQTGLDREDATPQEMQRTRDLVAYLESLGDADPRAKSEPLSDEAKAGLVGTYTFGKGEKDTLVFAIHRRGNLTIARADGPAQILNCVGPLAFTPPGATDVRIQFEAGADHRGTAIVIHDPMPLLRAVRE